MAEIVFTSVGELWRRVLPPGSKLLAGERGLSREVTWASTLRVRPPAFPTLGPGEMALLAADWLELIDPPLGLAQALEGLAQRGAAAAAVMGRVPEDAVRRAEGLGVPLLQLPEGVNIYELEGSIARFISGQRTALYQRGSEIHRSLMEASIQGKGMPGLLRVLAQATGKVAALLDQRYSPRHLAVPPGMRMTLQGLAAAFGEGEAGGSQGSPGATEAPGPAVLELPISLPGHEAVGCALSLGRLEAGYLVLVGPVGQMGPLERLALAQGANVFEAEMAKERAVVEAESRLKGDFLEELLEGDLVDEEEMVSRALHLGYDIAGTSVVVVIGVEQVPRPKSGAGDFAPAVMESLSRALPLGAAALARDGEVIVVMPVAETQGGPELAARGEGLRRQAADSLQGCVLAAGVGRSYSGLGGLRRSYREARQALALGRDMSPGGHTHFFGNLGVYPVLSPLWGTPEAEAFLQETLGRLLEYDRQNSAELVHSLDAYFSHRGSLTQSAEALHLHRNSLAYRLRRIQELTGLSLEEAEDCFRMQLALRLRRLSNP